MENSLKPLPEQADDDLRMLVPALVEAFGGVQGLANKIAELYEETGKTEKTRMVHKVLDATLKHIGLNLDAMKSEGDMSEQELIELAIPYTEMLKRHDEQITTDTDTVTEDAASTQGIEPQDSTGEEGTGRTGTEEDGGVSHLLESSEPVGESDLFPSEPGNRTHYIRVKQVGQKSGSRQ